MSARDHEMEIMRRGLRDLASLTQEGRRRVLAYWTARADYLGPQAEVETISGGSAQLDIEDHIPMMPRLKGGIA